MSIIPNFPRFSTMFLRDSVRKMFFNILLVRKIFLSNIVAFAERKHEPLLGEMSEYLAYRCGFDAPGMPFLRLFSMHISSLALLSVSNLFSILHNKAEENACQKQLPSFNR